MDAVVLHPVPYAGADRIAGVRLVTSSGPPRLAMVNADELRVLLAASTLDGAYIHGSFTKTLGGSSFPESVWIEDFSGNALSMLGVQPLLGRVFNEADAPIGSEPQRVAVLTYQFWQRRCATSNSGRALPRPTSGSMIATESERSPGESLRRGLDGERVRVD